MSTEIKTEYGADQIQILEGVEAVRKMCIRDSNHIAPVLQAQPDILFPSDEGLHCPCLLYTSFYKSI